MRPSRSVLGCEPAPSPDELVAELAGRQHGVVSLDQLRELGLTQDAVKRRVAARRLHRVHRGVYAVGHRGLGNKGTWLAAVMALGPTAVLSHMCAAALWRMLAPRPGWVDVLIPQGGGRRRRLGITLHYTRSLPAGDVRVVDEIPVTSPARTLLDLKRSHPTQYLRALRQAEFIGLPLDLPVPDGAERTRSELERRFLALCRRHGIPTPEVNTKLGPYEVDFVWRGARLVVEVDGWQGHRGRVAFELDHDRDVELRLMGYTVARFTYAQVMANREVTTRVMRLLALPGPP